MERLHCPVCGKRIVVTLMVPKDHVAAKAAVCSNETVAHVGFILYKFIDVSEIVRETSDQKELILN